MPPKTSTRFKTRLSVEDLREVWPLLSASDRLEGFRALDRAGAEEFFLSLGPADKAQMLLLFPESERRTWIRFLPPDDAADVVQKGPPEEREHLLNLIDEATRREVTALLAYAQDVAGGLMNPQFVRLRPEMSVDEAIRYLRKQTQEGRKGAVYYAYVLDPEQHLLGVVSFRQLLSCPPEKKMEEIMAKELVTVSDKMNQEAVSRLFAQHKLMAVPVLDEDYKMKGIVTMDDIIGVVQKVATEDIQKIGGTEALDEPYLQISFFKMLKKRAGWLTVLFLGEMLTATAMGYFEG